MANLKQFQTYDEQTADLQRRQRMAQMLQEQAMAPLESQVAPGGMVVPTSPLLGLSKMLQAYIGGKAQKGVDAQRGELSQRSTAEAQDFLRSLAPGAQRAMTPDAALAASLSAAPTEPQQMTSADRQVAIMQGAVSSNPRMQMAAQLAASMKPEASLKMGDINPKDFTPQSIAAAMASGDASRLEPTPKDDKPTVAGGMVWDPAQRKFVQIEGYADQAAAIAAAGRAAPAPDAPVAVMGPDGKPVYVNRSQAIGKTPYTATTLKQEQQELDKTRAQTQASLSAQETLDNAAILLQHPGRTGATGKTALLGSIPGTDAYDFSKRLDSFKAQTFIPMVSALKGMGALSDAEGKKLSESVGALDRSMSEEAFAQSLQQIMDSLYNKAQAAGLQVKKPDFSGGATPAPPPPPGFRRQ
jgi:hypothetical protein